MLLASISLITTGPEAHNLITTSVFFIASLHLIIIRIQIICLYTYCNWTKDKKSLMRPWWTCSIPVKSLPSERILHNAGEEPDLRSKLLNKLFFSQ